MGIPPNSTDTDYKRIFEGQVIRVFPSDEPRMAFQTVVNNEGGHDVHLGMVGKELIVRTRVHREAKERVYELVPTSKLLGHFPSLLISEYAHWHVAGEGVIEFRPLNRLWIPFDGTPGLVLRLDTHGSGCLGMSDMRPMVGLESATARILSDIFQPLDHPRFLHLTYDRGSSTLEIDLPRLGTKFRLRGQQSIIESRNYREFVVDQDQSLKALYGLKSKLILRSRNMEREELVSRAVLIPEGRLHTSRERQGYASAWLVPPETGASHSVRHHFFHVDEELGMLRGQGTLRSELWLCYLHALTSHFLPDPLTHCTGTERALRILNSSAVQSLVRSAGPDRDDDMALLRQISRVSPGRSLAHAAPGRMQRAAWSDISSLAQTDAFHEDVRRILQKARDFDHIFHRGRENVDPVAHSDTGLHQWHRTRLSPYERAGFRAVELETCFKNDNEPYEGLQPLEPSDDETRIYRLTRALMDPQPGLRTEHIEPWRRSIERISTILGCRVPEWRQLVDDGTGLPARFDEPDTQIKLPMGFDLRWLERPSVTMRGSWTDLHTHFCQIDLRADDSDRYGLIMFFGALSFARDADDQVIQLLLSLATSPATRPPALLAPSSLPDSTDPLPATQPLLTLTDGAVPDQERLTELAETHIPYSYIADGYGETRSSFIQRLVPYVMRQYPCENLQLELFCWSFPEGFARDSFARDVRLLFQSWRRNADHMDHLRSVIKKVKSFRLLNRSRDKETAICEIGWEQPLRNSRQQLSLQFLFEHIPPPKLEAPEPRVFWECFPAAPSGSPNEQIQPEMYELLDALGALSNRKHGHQQEYVSALQRSFESLLAKVDGSSAAAAPGFSMPSRAALKDGLLAHLHESRRMLGEMRDAMTASLRQMPGSEDDVTGWYSLWPRITPTVLLEQLSRPCWKRLNELALENKDGWAAAWQSSLVDFAKAWTVMQRARRLVMLADKGDNDGDLIMEMANVGHENWNPTELPEQLLFEVENGILIRQEQQTIAEHMRAPAGGNAVVQLDMGKGKSSVIVPIVAASLADAPRLVRVVVTKPQFQQMRQRLSLGLGGLLNREVYTLPFARRIHPDESRGQLINAMCQECGRNGGILLVQLDHILSFKLLGVEAAVSGKGALGDKILNAGFAFERHARDIVDEGDEIFNANFELTYTMGQQNELQFSPQRWRLIQAALDAVAEVLPEVQQEFPDSLALDRGDRAGSIPRIRILRTSATPRLLDQATRRVFEKGHEGLPTLRSLSGARQKAILRYITERDPAPEDIALAEEVFATETERQPLLVLRGLMACGILEFALHGKRWRVNYGRDYDREANRNGEHGLGGQPVAESGLAVPYRGKDSPAPNAEFAHPDVVIVLTCLSYYYQGLSDDELFDLFDHLRASDHGETEYEQWALLDRDVPRSLAGVNVKDRPRCKAQIFSRLRNLKPVIDSYLSNLLFPRRMREFPRKLSASSWDLAGERKHPITGFSGTNDSQHLLPWSIRQSDPKAQRHTNASVLNRVLRPENMVRTLGPKGQGPGGPSSTDGLLRSIVDCAPSIQVVLDVGAQFVEHGNLDVAKIWLAIVPPASAKAVITFNDDDELVVVTRDAQPELLAASPFWHSTASCLVFLDEVHTRGTDIALPDDYRAAVTLGPGLTKDKLVQGVF